MIGTINNLCPSYSQLGIQANTPAELVAKSKEIVGTHRQLQTQTQTLQAQIDELEASNMKLVSAISTVFVLLECEGS